MFLFAGPTPIHAPRPRPISYSIGIGTSDFGAAHTDASTHGGPPPLELSSFLQDLALNATSSPVSMATVSVLSPNFQRYLDSGLTARSPPPPRVSVCQSTSTRDEVQYVDVAVNAVCDCADVSVDACVSSVDKVVQAAVETSDAFTVHDPPVEFPPVASPLADDVPEVVESVVDEPGPPSTSSTEAQFDIPEDFSFGGSLSVGPDLDDAVPADTGSRETSPMGPSLIDSNDEPIASRLPGYLNSFKTCEVSDRHFSFIRFFLFSLPFFCLAIQTFLSFHLFFILLVLFDSWLFKFHFSLFLSLSKVFKCGVFCLCTF